MNVVTRAIMTIIVNRVGVITPRERPMFNRISSIRPRVFISTPTDQASFQASPLSRAAVVQPAIFPAIAVSTSRPHMAHINLPCIVPISVRRPV